MHKLIPASFVVALALGTGLAAAETGEADPAGSRATPSQKVPKAERKQARKERLSETAQANKSGQLQPGGERGEASGNAASDGKYSKEERKQARKQRRADTAKANKAGQIPSGEAAGEAPPSR